MSVRNETCSKYNFSGLVPTSVTVKKESKYNFNCLVPAHLCCYVAV